jgi:hypothetical protein
MPTIEKEEVATGGGGGGAGLATGTRYFAAQALEVRLGEGVRGDVDGEKGGASRFPLDSIGQDSH